MDYIDSEIPERPMPLAGVRVVEYAVFHAGPRASAIMSDLGAEVVKIEEKTGDPERYWTSVGGIDLTLANGDSIWYHISNRNKRSVCLDITNDKGREILFRLVKDADVFLCNLRKSTKERLGIDYAGISAVNRKIIYAGVSGYGPEGPLSDLGAFDPLGQARSGMMFATGSERPALINLGVLDQATAIAASHGIITALFARERQGIGQEVHISLLSTGLWLLYGNLMMIGCLSKDPCMEWDRSRNSPLRNLFRCKDGKWLVGSHHPEERYWPLLCRLTGQEHLLSDPRLSDDKGRIAHNEELMAVFDRVFATRTRDEWMEIFVEHGMMFSPVQRAGELSSDPQALANDYMVDFDFPGLGHVRIPGYPVRFGRNGAGTRKMGPAIGEHTDEVMQELGYSEEEIKNLREGGAIS
jgi:crotonobetainyl-CoA:carnitine CoA-transferase CaiB-like acyl-CoA transferase